LDLLLREVALAKGAAHAVSLGGDGKGLEGAGGVEEGKGGRLVVPDLGMAVAPANDDGREVRLLEREAQVIAVADLGGAVTAKVGGDLVISQGYLGADDAAIIGDFAVLADVLLHSSTPYSIWRSTPITFP
jgi:hypothetical protein